ncbi:response regulator transcription factor [Hyphobacterium marinum]|uniref:Response regulator transcription factor n=1 Tax=Hyphobacterium marinum TaxID=3116574 RepID=A0ABU7LVQ1_9PROT|nr:response regulator transcription factor [Hyphobacterium sp. Y6023]MEE2565599.1 response regulator transcription factor [Hyphobacterium sp. Y6023]
MKTALIVEDVGETRRWLSGILQSAYPGCEVEEAATMRAGLAAVAARDFDIALIDLGLPDGSGLEVLRSLRLLRPETISIVTTVMGEDAYIVSALSAGASGYLLKETPEDLLTRQLVQLAEGIPAISPSIARRIMDHFRLTGPAAELDNALTARESEVLGLIARGLRNADVAQALSLAESTVASHIKAIYRKLGISSRAEASWHATRLGLAVPKPDSAV